MQWFKKLFAKRAKNPHYVAYEKSNATRVFDELEDVAIKKQRIVAYRERLERKYADVKKYQTITEEDIQKLTSWSGQHREIIEQKQLLKGRLIRNNRALMVLAQYEDELPQLMAEVAKTERQVKENERDLIYLQEEKESILEEREVLLRGYSFLKYFSGAMVLVLAVLMLGGYGLLQMLGDAIWLYISMISIGFVLILGGIVFSKEYLEKALRHNEKLQKKVVRYINKTKVRYFHNKRYLLFNFDKLGVDSSAKLEMYYNRYIKNKDNERQYGDLNRSLMQIEADITSVFDTYDVFFEDMELLEEWLKAPHKGLATEPIREELEKLVIQIKGFDAFEETLWKEVEAIKQEGKQRELVEERLRQYLILTKQHLDKQVETA